MVSGDTLILCSSKKSPEQESRLRLSVWSATCGLLGHAQLSHLRGDLHSIYSFRVGTDDARNPEVTSLYGQVGGCLLLAVLLEPARAVVEQ